MKDKNKKEEFKEEINHEEHKENCDKNCHCHDGEKCSCDENCKCEDCECFECAEESQPVDQYLALAQRVQADFENYRRRMADQLVLERQEGARSVIDVFLPCLDTFKEAKKSISVVHEVIAVMNDESKEDNIILDEYQAGYKFNGKVIRYSKVIVNKGGKYNYE